MRRLTDFEENIVKKIVEADIHQTHTSFKTLIESEVLKYMGFNFGTAHGYKVDVFVDKEGYQSSYLYTEDSDLPTQLMKMAKHHYSYMLTIALLLKLLVKNELIILGSVSFGLDRKEYIGKEFTDGRERTILFNANEEIINLFRSVNEDITAAPALLVYKNNGYRTEEQKKNDEESEINNTLIKQNEKSIGIAESSAKAAKNAVYVSAFAVFLTLGYTVIHDYFKDKDDEKKDIRNEFFRTKVMIQVDKASDGIDSIRKDLKKTKPVPVKK